MIKIASKNGKPVTIAEIRDLIIKGYTVAQVAEEKGISRQAVYQKIKEDDRRRGVLTTADDVANKLTTPRNKAIVNAIGTEKASAFVQYHLELFKMGQGCDKKNVPDLYERFANYLQYCIDNGVVPNNMSAYLAIGVTRLDISQWQLGHTGTPEHQKFAEEISAFFASIHEQGGTDGLMNPIQTIFWQKAYDGLSDQPKDIEITLNPLGEKRSAEQIAKDYGDLPD